MENYLEYGNEGVDCKGNKWKRIPLGRIAKDCSNQKYNRLLPLFRVSRNGKSNLVYWLCKCDCGNLLATRAQSLCDGSTKSCGCAHIEQVSHLHNTPNDLTGQIFGFLLVKSLVPKELKPSSTNRHAFWYCDCLNCGTKNKIVSADSLTRNTTRSCGCIKSLGERKILDLLNSNNIKFKFQIYVKDCILSTGGSPYFDFAILNTDDSIAYFIEYQGEQHYIYRNNGYFTEDKVKLIQQRDKDKKDYCEKIIFL